MSTPVRFLLVAFTCVGSFAAGPACGQNEGQEDLDSATEIKLTYRTLSDLGEVIRLCESALAKGLDEDNTRFAKSLLGSTRIKRGTGIAATILGDRTPDPMWPQFRRIALEDLEKGIELQPERPNALMQIAQLNLLPGGDADRAAAALDDAIRLAADEPRLRANALILRASSAKDPEKGLADLNEAARIASDNAAPVFRLRAMMYAKKKDFKAALADFDAAIAIDSEHAPTHVERGKVLIEMERYEEAIEALSKAKELAPTWTGPRIHLARAHALKSDFKTALEVLDEAYEEDPDDLAVLLLRASVYQELEKSDEALADVDRVLELKPGLDPAMRFRAALLARSGKFDLAAAQLEELEQANPDDLEIELQLAFFYSAEKQFDKAAEKFTAVIGKDSDHVVALRGRGDAVLNLGKQAEAIADYDKAVKLNSEDPGLLNNFAWVLATSPDAKLRDGPRAIELATKACELTDYKLAHILSTLAAGYAETGDFEKAIEWSEKALKIATGEHVEPLTKELETYRKGKPFRERFGETATESPEPSDPAP